MGAERRHGVAREPAQPRQRPVLRRAPEETGVLALQRSAGNRAVAEQMQVARDHDAGDSPPKQKHKNATVQLDDLAPVEIESFSIEGGDRDEDVHKLTAVADAEKLGNLAALIPKWAATGHKFSKVDVAVQSRVIHLGDVYIASWKGDRGARGHMLSFTLEFVSIRVDGGDKPPDGKPDSPRWDPGPGG